MQQDNIMLLVQEFATRYLEKNLHPDLLFHNTIHTQNVVDAASEIGEHTDLSAYEIETVCIAAWFHDLGFSIKYKDHETQSIDIAKNFLIQNGLADHQIETIISCIDATRYPQKPLDLLEMVICDADFYHFSRTDYWAREQALRKEWELCLNLFYTDREWNRINFELLNRHQYFTNYGQVVLQPKKEENLRKLQRMLEN